MLFKQFHVFQAHSDAKVALNEIDYFCQGRAHSQVNDGGSAVGSLFEQCPCGGCHCVEYVQSQD